MLLRCNFGLYVLSVFAIVPLSAQSLSTQEAMHSKVQSIYGFSPSKVTADIRESKSKEMDGFWGEVKSHKEAELPLLRNELADPNNPRFFFADGSGLLLSISDSPEDQRLAVNCLAKVDLSDFQSRQFLMEIHALALKGTNVAPAALHILDVPKFEVFLPEHGAYRLDQSSCLLVSFLPLKNDVWLPSVLERLKVERDETALKSLLLLLFYAQSDEADRAISSFAIAPSSSAHVREFAQTIIKHEHELGVGTHPSSELEARFREERRVRMASVSDEAMDDLEILTGKIAKARSLSPAHLR